MIRGTGYLKSILDGSEFDYDRWVENKTFPLPETLNYSKICTPLKRVKDQGQTSMCVPFTLDYIISTDEFMHNPKLDKRFSIDREKVYNSRTNESNGMQPREALEYLKHTGYKVGQEIHRIKGYGKLKSIDGIKKALVANGPCLFALPYYEDYKGNEFWKGKERIGGHAICCVGWTGDGFILENSWGSSWGHSGKAILLWEDINRLLEAWTILK